MLSAAGLFLVVFGIIEFGWAFFHNSHLFSIGSLEITSFGAMMAVAFKRLRPLFRKRNEINSEITGRLGEALGLKWSDLDFDRTELPRGTVITVRGRPQRAGR